MFCCAYPFEYEMPEETLCTACLRERSKFDRARSVFAYDDSSWLLVIEFKHADKTFAAQTLAGMTCRAGAELLDDAGLIKPVPLHLRRLFACGYIRPRFWPSCYRGKPALPYPWTCGCGGVTQNRRDECRRLRGSAMSRALVRYIRKKTGGGCAGVVD